MDRKKKIYAVYRGEDFVGIQDAVSPKQACATFSRRGSKGYSVAGVLTARFATKEQIESVCPMCRYFNFSVPGKMHPVCRANRVDRIQAMAAARRHPGG